MDFFINSILGIVVAAIALAAAAAFTGHPKFVLRWLLQSTFDPQPALAALKRDLEQNRITKEEYDKTYAEAVEVYGKQLKKVENRISLLRRKDRVARRRPIQHKLGRI